MASFDPVEIALLRLIDDGTFGKGRSVPSLFQEKADKGLIVLKTLANGEVEMTLSEDGRRMLDWYMRRRRQLRRR